MVDSNEQPFYYEAQGTQDSATARWAFTSIEKLARHCLHLTSRCFYFLRLTWSIQNPHGHHGELEEGLERCFYGKVSEFDVLEIKREPRVGRF